MNAGISHEFRVFPTSAAIVDNLVLIKKQRAVVISFSDERVTFYQIRSVELLK